MLSIDEAIQRENKIAEENQKIVDTQIVFDDVSIPELYCDDTEVIEEHLDNYKKCVEYHEQIAEWLEELKAYRENSNGYNKEDIELNRNAMYNKAIDDLFEDANEMAIEVDTGTYTLKAIGIGLLEQIAEQLKAGGKNEKERNAFDNAKQIVQEVAEEFAADINVGTNGWIPCSYMLPEEEANVLLSLRSLDVYTGFRANAEGCFYIDGDGYVEY